MHVIAILVITAVAVSGLLGLALLGRQASAVAANRAKVPAHFASEVSLEEHQGAADYALARTRLAMARTAFAMALDLLWLTVLLGPLYTLVSHVTSPGIGRSVAIVMAAVFTEQLLTLPFSIYATFAIEARFGFNRATIAMFALDRVKGMALFTLVAVPALTALLWLMAVLPSLWWLIAFAGFMALAILLSVIFPSYIAPFFNKFTPLPEGELKAQGEALLARCGFTSKGLYVMDASRRSAHGNAYFTGFGKAKRIVLFDTLLQNHSRDEILSILAHELGHYKLGHISQRLALMSALSFAGFAILGIVLTHGSLASAFGLPPDPGLDLIVAAIAGQPAAHFLSPFLSALSRRAEYQADHFAKMMAGPAPMISALVKLARNNLSTLTPDSLYAAFYYSHPPVPARIEKLSAG